MKRTVKGQQQPSMGTEPVYKRRIECQKPDNAIEHQPYL
jgi:hypothetical protein